MSSGGQTGGAREVSPQTALFHLLGGYTRTQLIYVMAKLGLADLLRNGSRSSSDLSAALQAEPRILHRILRGLVNIGLLAQDEDARYHVTDLGDCLRSDAPDSLQGWAIFSGEILYRAWADLFHSVQTGETAFNHVFGLGLYDYLAEHDDLAAHFHRSMTVSTMQGAEALCAAYDFSSIDTLVDVGGGYGVLLTTILEAYPSMRGILFDAPAAIAEARLRLEARGLADRCDTVEGSFFSAVPGGGDAYILSWILLDWEDAQALRILQNCRRAMPSHGRLLLFEAVLPERIGRNDPVVSRDLSMLVMAGGGERTGGEFATLLAQAGFRLTRIIPTAVNRHVIEAVPSDVDGTAPPMP